MSVEGKTIVLTGASSGIGRAAALELARRGARLVLVCRNAAKAEAVVAACAGPERPAVVLADLGEQAQVRRAAAEILALAPRIDVLVNNAGAFHHARTLTKDGLETTFAVNHLAYFLLTRLLLPRLEASAPARVVNVASNAHMRGRIDFDDLMGERWDGGRAYAQSKLANMLFTMELARRLEGTGVTANCLHPGVVASRFAMGEGGVVGLFFKLARPFLRSEEDGAKTIVYLATADALPIPSGGYYADERPARRVKRAVVYDAELARRLWEESERLTAGS